MACSRGKPWKRCTLFNNVHYAHQTLLQYDNAISVRKNYLLTSTPQLTSILNNSAIHIRLIYNAHILSLLDTLLAHSLGRCSRNMPFSCYSFFYFFLFPQKEEKHTHNLLYPNLAPPSTTSLTHFQPFLLFLCT